VVLSAGWAMRSGAGTITTRVLPHLSLMCALCAQHLPVLGSARVQDGRQSEVGVVKSHNHEGIGRLSAPVLMPIPRPSCLAVLH
jgi:hypothetical protein